MFPLENQKKKKKEGAPPSFLLLLVSLQAAAAAAAVMLLLCIFLYAIHSIPSVALSSCFGLSVWLYSDSASQLEQQEQPWSVDSSADLLHVFLYNIKWVAHSVRSDSRPPVDRMDHPSLAPSVYTRPAEGRITIPRDGLEGPLPACLRVRTECDPLRWSFRVQYIQFVWKHVFYFIIRLPWNCD